jgi:hypothetical protein
MRTSPTRLLAAGLLGVLVGVVQVAFAQSSNTEVGTWKMNIAKSKFSAGTASKSGTVKFEAAGTGIKVAVDSVDADGTVRHWAFTANYDGKDNPITGDSPYGDVVARTRIDAHTTRSIYKKSGEVTVTQTAVVSSDGKTRSVTATGTNAMGRPVDNVTFYDKQVRRR